MTVGSAGRRLRALDLAVRPQGLRNVVERVGHGLAEPALVRVGVAIRHRPVGVAHECLDVVRRNVLLQQVRLEAVTERVCVEAAAQLLGELLAPAPEQVRLQVPVALCVVLAGEQELVLGLVLDQSDENGQVRLAEGKSVVGLESLESQLEMLSGLPARVQDLMLRDRLRRSGGFTSQAREMRNAWRRGDDEALARIVFERIDDPEFAELYERSLFDRSQRMADRIAALSGDGKTRLVVVGAAHMLGDRGIPELLVARGFDVQRATTQ